MKPLDQLTHYEVLELEPGASADDVRRSFERLRQVFAPGSLATYSLVDSFDQQRMMSRLEEAYQVLADDAARSAYDQRNDLRAALPHPAATLASVERVLAAGERPNVVEHLAAVPAPTPLRPPMPHIAPDTDFTGDLLRQVREARGLTVRQLADITRIGTGYLQAIEQEAFDRLPDRVYLRGFLVSVGRELKLDSNRVAASYLVRWEAGRPGRN